MPETIARLTNERESTWFTGYGEKFFIDRGALFSCMSPRCAALLCLQFAIRHRSLFRSEFRWFEALRLMLEGSRSSANGEVRRGSMFSYSIRRGEKTWTRFPGRRA